MPKHLQRVWQEAEDTEREQHEQQRLVAGVPGAAGGSGDRRSGDSDDDRDHREVLPPAGALAEHPLSGDHQHEQSRGERRLDDDEWRMFEGDHLQWPSEHRKQRAEQPAPAAEQPCGEREAQMHVGGSLPCVHRLEGDPYAVEDRGADGREHAQDQIDHDRR